MKQQYLNILRGSVGVAIACAQFLVACSGAMPGDEHTGSSEQALTGSLQIHGRVTSPTGVPLSGVKVTLTGASNTSMTTGTSGAYSFTSLGAGAYTVTPSKTGLAFCTPSASLPTLRTDAVEDFSGSTSGCQAAVHTRNATVLIYDPLITNPDGTQVKLSAYKNWEEPNQLVDRFKRSIQSMTNGRVKYNVVKTTTINAFPVKADGFQYTQASYLACLADSTQCHAADTANVLAMLSSQGICSAVNAGTTDELWLFGGPYFGTYESQLTGPKAFTYNSPPLEGSTCNKLLPIMGFNYERSLAEMVHDTMHRTEATLSRVYGNWAENSLANNWDRFALIAAQSPSFGYSGCGTAHFAPNSTSDYDYSDPNPVSSFCDDFFNYPTLKTPSTALKTITCSAWGCDELAYYRYFFQHLPKAAGTGTDGKFNDWWRYVAKPNDVFLTDPASCSSEYTAGWCNNVLDGIHGQCNVGEWATASLPTGFAQVNFPSAKSITSVTVFDRACDEQVLAGHLEFSDGSAKISFGALENTGTTGTKLSFAAKSLSWVKVVIDQSSGANPGLGEIVAQ
jgi:Carboxypeptidase regulatory-like domain